MKPILFNTEMVRAILDGRKTQTRRVIKLKYSNTHLEMKTDKYGTELVEIQNDIEGETYGKNSNGTTWRNLRAYVPANPKYKIGDILYVQETWGNYGEDYPDGNAFYYLYKADFPKGATGYWHELEQINWCDFPIWRSPKCMPKEAARIFLKVTSVRAERLQDIDDNGCKAEGVVYDKDDNPTGLDFSEIWNSTIKKKELDTYGWDANPWVWVYKFERISKEVAQP